MSTVVDNDKYIINGSTLSAIGDALREAGASTRIVTETKYYKTDMTGGDERTVSASFFTGLSSTPTQVLIQVTQVTSTSCRGITSPIQQKLSAGDQFVLSLPFKYQGYSYTSYGSTVNYYVKLNLYPLDAEGNLMIPETTTGYTAVITNREQILPILVEDIATSIQGLNKIALLAPFAIGGYNNYSTASTVLPENIHTITDIKKLYMIIPSGNSSYIRIARLEPSTATATYYSSLGGGLGAGTAYRMRYYDFSRTTAATATWETTIAQSTGYYDIFFEQSQRKLVQVTGGSTTTVNAIATGAFLIY